MNLNACLRCFWTLSIVGGSLSCSSTAKPPARPDIDGEKAAAKALELFDSNADGQLDDEELKQSPGLADGKQRADANGDGRLSGDEIAQRIESYRVATRRLISVPLHFSTKRRDLQRVQVVIEPEPFLEEWLKPASGETDASGTFTPAISRALPGMHLGYYRVKVSHEVGGKQRIPEQFNAKTELGVELCDDRPREDGSVIHFQLDSRKRR